MIACAWLLTWSAPQVRAESDDTSRIARSALLGLLDSYSRLSSGEFTAAGIYEVPEHNRVWDLELACKFDRTKQRSLHWRREWSEENDESCLQILGPDSRLGWMSSSWHKAGIHLPEDVTELGHSERPRYRIWTMSVTETATMDRSFQSIAAQFMDERAMAALESAKESNDGELELVWYEADEHWSTVLTLDSNRSFVPLRYKVGRPAEDDHSRIVKLQNDVETQWMTRDGVIVPVSWTGRQYDLNSGKPEISASLDFDWTNVNQPISPGAFEWQQAGLPEGTKVYDDRLGKNVLIGRVGTDRPLIRLFDYGTGGSPVIREEAVRRGVWLLFATVALIICSLFWFRRRRRSEK